MNLTSKDYAKIECGNIALIELRPENNYIGANSIGEDGEPIIYVDGDKEDSLDELHFIEYKGFNIFAIEGQGDGTLFIALYKPEKLNDKM